MADLKYKVKVARSPNDGELGYADHRNQTIYIDPDQASGMIRDTLVHEMLHVVLCNGGLFLPEEADQEERFVRALTPWFIHVLRSNPSLVRYLTHG